MSSLPDGFQPATIQTSNNIFRDNVITNNFNDASSKFLGYINQAYWATWLNLQTLVIALIFWPCLHLFVPKDSIMDYNEMVFFHSLVCLIGASYLLYDTHKNLRLAWWKGENYRKPFMTVLMIFASTFFLTIIHYYEDWEPILFNCICVFFFGYVVTSGKYIQLICTHLFFYEIGTFVWIAEHLFQHPGAWEGVVGLWLIVTRIIWCCWCIKYVFLPYKRGEVQRGNIVNGNIESTPSNDIKDMRATMKLLDWVCLLVSIFLCISCTLYSFVHAIIEADAMEQQEYHMGNKGIPMQKGPQVGGNPGGAAGTAK